MMRNNSQIFHTAATDKLDINMANYYAGNNGVDSFLNFLREVELRN